MKRIALVALGLLGVAFVLPALAAPSVDLTLEVQSAQLAADCSGGSESWEVAAEISVLNTNENTVTFESTDFSAKFNQGGGGQGSTEDVSVISSDGFESGAQVAAGETRVFHPAVRVTLPCDVTAANLVGQVILVGRDTTYSDTDAFIEGGTPVPIGPTGILGVALILGIAGLLAQRLGRKPRTLVVDRPDA